MPRMNKAQIKSIVDSMTPEMLFNSEFSSYKDEPWSTPLEFFESDRFCGLHLYPNQRLMLKLWNLQIDDLTDYENKTLDEWCKSFKNDKYKVGVLPDIRERIAELKKNGYKHFSTIIEVFGRRASKSFMSGNELALADAQMLWHGIPSVQFDKSLADEQDEIVGGSDFWQQDKLDDTQDNSGIDKDTAVYSIVMATTMSQAQETIFKDYYNAVLSCQWLQQYILRITPFQITYQTPNDKLKTLDYLERGIPIERELASMVSRPVSSNSNAVRGRAVAKFCLGSDSLVKMSDGSEKRIIDLNIGDRLQAFDENDVSDNATATVLAKSVESKPTKRIWFTDGTYIDATDEHKFVDEQGNWVEVKDLNVGDRLQEQFECQICHKAFATVSGLHKHISFVHNEHKTTLCPICNCVLKSSRSVAGHLRKHNDSLNHSSEHISGIFKCDICNREFSSSKGMNNHKRYHDSQYREQRRKSHFGRVVSEESRKKNSETHKSICSTEEWKAADAIRKNDPQYRANVKAGVRRLWATASDEYIAWRKAITAENGRRSALSQSTLRKSHKWGIRSKYTSLKTGKTIKCDSSWEAWLCKLLDMDDNVISFDRANFGIDYEYDGKRHVYFPDFIVNSHSGTYLVEVKDDRFVNDGRVLAKADAAVKYCKANGMTYVMMVHNDLLEYESSLEGGGANEADSED